MCGCNIHNVREVEYVDNPNNSDECDEYCKECFTILDGKFWTGNWDSDGNPITGGR